VNGIQAIGQKFVRLWSRFRHLLFNMSYRMLGHIISRLLGLISLPIISRALGPLVYGKWSEINIFTNYVNMPIFFGYCLYGLRQIANHEDNEKAVSELMSTQLMFAFVSILLGAGAATVLFWHDPQLLFCSLFALIASIGTALNLDYYFLGNEDTFRPSAIQVLSHATFVGIIVLTVHHPGDLLQLVAAFCIQTLLVAYLAIRCLPKGFYLRLTLSWKLAFSKFRKSLHLGFAVILEGVQASVVLIAVSSLMGTYQLGLFNAPWRLIIIFNMLYTAINQSLAPYLAKLPAFAPKKAMKYFFVLNTIMLAVGVVSAAVLSLFARLIIHILFGSQFMPALPAYYHLAWAYLPLIPVQMLICNILIYYHLDHVYANVKFIGVLFSIAITIPLVKYHGLLGGAWACGISTFFMIILYCFRITRRILHPEEPLAVKAPDSASTAS
jgi:O-antigen/teichoic acid export membrane protein